MRQGLGQQALAALVVVLSVALTLAVGFIVAQTDSAARLGDVTPTGGTTSSITSGPVGTATQTPTSAILEQATFPTAQPPLTNTPFVCSYPAGWQPAVVSASDTIGSLAARYATSAETLMQGNCLTGPGLQAGQTLYVPPLPTATEERCGPPPGWKTYTVKSGENLFRIGLRYGQSVDAMLKANCLTSEQVKAGQTLFVPPVTPLPPTATSGPPASATPAPNQTPTLVAGCDDPGAQITSPANGAVVRDDIFFFGTADAADFASYKLEIRPANGGEFITFHGAEAPVLGGFLGQVGAYAFVPGDYTIRLAVVDTTAAIVGQCSITLTLEGGPTATLTG